MFTLPAACTVLLWIQNPAQPALFTAMFGLAVTGTLSAMKPRLLVMIIICNYSGALELEHLPSKKGADP